MKISDTRKFDGRVYRTTREVFRTPEQAKARAREIKEATGGTSVRVVKRTKPDVFYLVYVLEEDFPAISGSASAKPAPTAVKKTGVGVKKPATRGAKKPAHARNKATTSQNTETTAATESWFYSPPAYLVERMTKAGKKYLKMGLRAMRKQSPEKIHKILDVLAAEKIKYDPTFEKERKFLRFLDGLLSELSATMEAKLEAAAIEWFRTNVEVPLSEGKFDQFVEKFSRYYGAQEVAVEIHDSIGARVRRKYPFPETHLIRQIRALLERTYPEKAKLRM
ncbi:MAG: hypothetical protein Kow0069_13860 [Promethearchaeota archaeon]